MYTSLSDRLTWPRVVTLPCESTARVAGRAEVVSKYEASGRATGRRKSAFDSLNCCVIRDVFDLVTRKWRADTKHIEKIQSDQKVYYSALGRNCGM